LQFSASAVFSSISESIRYLKYFCMFKKFRQRLQSPSRVETKIFVFVFSRKFRKSFLTFREKFTKIFVFAKIFAKIFHFAKSKHIFAYFRFRENEKRGFRFYPKPEPLLQYCVATPQYWYHLIVSLIPNGMKIAIMQDNFYGHKLHCNHLWRPCFTVEGAQ
jgi:hypothetical protein